MSERESESRGGREGGERELTEESVLAGSIDWDFSIAEANKS